MAKKAEIQNQSNQVDADKKEVKGPVGFEDLVKQAEDAEKFEFGISQIAEERGEQISKHGHNLLSDQQYDKDELVTAAIQYLVGPEQEVWPEAMDKKWYKPSPENRIRELRIAGALIAAEIDRINNNEAVH